MSREPEEFLPSEIRFIGEQDGIPERELKAKISDFLRRNGYKCRVYLARAKYNASDELNVVLCARVVSGDADALKAAAGRIFHDMFRSDAHLDIMILTDEEEQVVWSVCRPFSTIV
jgi:hypothetical protein